MVFYLHFKSRTGIRAYHGPNCPKQNTCGNYIAGTGGNLRLFLKKK